jgi:GrpB-like predicted nucleotidyltransferase (UPF0157 family)
VTDEGLIARLIREHVEIVPYDPRWPESFEREKNHLVAVLPRDLIGRIEHFGSTAIPGTAAKPIVDMLVEVADLDAVKRRIVPMLQMQGYDYIWRPTSGDDVPPWYAWFIGRDPATGVRTHHIHMVEPGFPQWEALAFRDYLRVHPDVAAEYVALKLRLAAEFPNDREAYTRRKTDFVARVTQLARGARPPQ